MIDCSIGVVVVGDDLIWAVPLVARLTHSLVLLVRAVLLSIRHAHAVDMLGLSFAHNGTHRLRNAIWANWWILPTGTIVPKVHLVHVVDTAFPHLVLGRHRYVSFASF